jgi:uncharacterized protein YkuJ
MTSTLLEIINRLEKIAEQAGRLDRGKEAT